ncbi:MAG: LamG domain-containing protein, partial [Candidatus Aenigmarchaeota archaeon]|nr:LamG domain-containing protein [Candidatus Aenigmarchaeota archaeon]
MTANKILFLAVFTILLVLFATNSGYSAEETMNTSSVIDEELNSEPLVEIDTVWLGTWTYADGTIRTITWQGGTSTNWSVASNWNYTSIPDADDLVILNASAPNQPIISQNVTVINITLGGTLKVNTSVNGYPLYLIFNDTAGADATIGFRGNGNASFIGTEEDNVIVTTVSASPASARHFRLDGSSIASNWTANWTDFDEYYGISTYVLYQNFTLENCNFQGYPTHPWDSGTSGVNYPADYKWYNVTIPNGAYTYLYGGRQFLTGIVNSVLGDINVGYQAGKYIEFYNTTINSFGYYAVSQNAGMISKDNDKFPNDYVISMSSYNVPTTPSIGSFKKSSLTLYDFGSTDNVFIGHADGTATGQFEINENAVANSITLSQTTAGSTNVSGGYTLNVSDGISIRSGTFYLDSGIIDASIPAKSYELDNNSTLASDPYLYAYYKFDNGAETVDETGIHNLANNEMVDGTAQTGFGNAQNSLNTRGANVTSTDDFEFNDNFTASIWIKANTTPVVTGGYILDKDTPATTGYGWDIYTSSGNTLYTFQIRNLTGGWSTSKSVTIPDTNWHLLTAVYDHNYICLYLDAGIYGKSCSAETRNIQYSTNEFHIGTNSYNPPATSSSFNGTIDEVAIWNRSLSRNEIYELWRNKASGQQLIKGYKTNHYIQPIGQNDFPASPSGTTSLSKYVNVTNTSTSSWLQLNLTYNTSNTSITKPQILIYNGTKWFSIGSTNSTTLGYATANLTTFFSSGLIGLFDGDLVAPDGSTCTWTGSESSNWTNANNWNCEGVRALPCYNCYAVLNASATNQTVLSNNTFIHNVSIPTGSILSTMGYNLTINGVFYITGTFNQNLSYVNLLNSSTALNITSGGIFNAQTGVLNVTGNTEIGGILNGNYSTIDMNGDLLTSAGTLNATTGTFTFAGSNWNHPTTFTTNSGRVYFDRSGTTTITGSSPSMYSITVNSGTTVVLNTTTFTLSKTGSATDGRALLISGTFNASSSNLLVGSGGYGAWYDSYEPVYINSTGTFIGGTGTHTFGGVTIVAATSNWTMTNGTTNINGGSNTGQCFYWITTAAGLTGSGTGTLNFTYASGTQTYFSSTHSTLTVPGNLHISKTTGTFTSRSGGDYAANIIVNGNLTSTNGGFTGYGNYNMTVLGNTNLSGGNFYFTGYISQYPDTMINVSNGRLFNVSKTFLLNSTTGGSLYFDSGNANYTLSGHPQTFKAYRTLHSGVLSYPTLPGGYRNVSYVNVTNTSTSSWLYLNITYSSSYVANDLGFYAYDGTNWVNISSDYVDTTNSIAYVNITSFYSNGLIALLEKTNTTWTGNTNTDWSTSTNWHNGVPTSETLVYLN